MDGSLKGPIPGPSYTIDPWTQSLIENGDMIKANVSSGLDRGDILFVEKDDDGKLRTTWKEIVRSMIAGKLVVVREMQFADATAAVGFDVLIAARFTKAGGWAVRSILDNRYYADSADGAPVAG